MLIGTEPLVMQIGNRRWSGDTTEAGTTLHKDGHAIVQIRAIQDAGVEVSDARGAAILQVAGDGAIANARGDVLRRAEVQPAAVKIGDSMVTGTSDVALAVLITAPELVPEVRGLAACQRLFAREQAARK